MDGGIIFELKFDRSLNTISEKTFHGIVKDIQNFEIIYNRFNNNGLGYLIYGYFVLFIKSNINDKNMEKIYRIQSELTNRGLNETKCKLLYCFIGVDNNNDNDPL